MKRILFGSLLALGIATVAVQNAAAQARFAPGTMELGATVGLGTTGDAASAFGARVERSIKKLEGMGGGTLGVQLAVDYYSWEFGLGYRWQFIPVGLTANYHFDSGDGRFAPFLGAGLGYSTALCGGPKNVWGDCSAYGSELYPIARAGARFSISSTTAIYGDVGAGKSVGNIGLMWKLK